tara:strand:+ start:262 stop:420 length:159 start_codon:yes stop_codon:yes gene_type:complete
MKTLEKFLMKVAEVILDDEETFDDEEIQEISDIVKRVGHQLDLAEHDEPNEE